ncbi:DUF4249 domain-containing protein [Hymenobacter weizhouensis]|uniref:DUF4249 domain-containing protein n=1 Tax=Hymenobacter sp. YIM 151500-1 TaxID=2987689 RepID=UPI002226FE7E|nr:DUF4249 domain-containing protein [Hymenobacter sp. YIM 151500-1]UYZ64992.1 DUF4249 domain-containing protein [Hymenobacter sp. YIM 151500-1]
MNEQITKQAYKSWKWLSSLVLLALTAACNLEKDVDVVLPAYPPQLVVEAYLENGEVPRLTVSESVPYLATPEPKVPTDVTAILTLANGRREVLRFAPGVNRTTGKAFTHVGTSPVVARPGDTFSLELTDTQGRRVTGTATMPARVPIDTVEWEFNARPEAQREAYLLTRFRDPAATLDYYRLMVHKDSLSNSPELEYTAEDRLLNGQEFTLGTSYRFRPNDTLFVTLYHLDQPYFQFLQSVEDARNANGNPFGQPSVIKSTVQGGIGIFTILSYDRRRVVVK